MKRFTVNVHYDYLATVEVQAETESEALLLAGQQAEGLNLSEMECMGTTGSCVTNVEELPTETDAFVLSIDVDVTQNPDEQSNKFRGAIYKSLSDAISDVEHYIITRCSDNLDECYNGCLHDTYSIMSVPEFCGRCNADTMGVDNRYIYPIYIGK